MPALISFYLRFISPFICTAGGAGLGGPSCPRLCETPLLEPVVVKKIAHERLSALVFKEECIVTACQVPPLLSSQLETCHM